MTPSRGSGDFSASEPLLSAPLTSEDQDDNAAPLLNDGSTRQENGVDIADYERPTSFVWTLTAVAAISGLLFGYDTGIISSTLYALSPSSSNASLPPSLGRIPTTWDKSVITSITSFGGLVFSPLSGPLADFQGRQRTLHLAASFFVAGALIQAFAHSVWVMELGRFVVGAAVGLSSGAAGVYVAEVAPAKWRGRMVVVTALGITAGQVVAYIVGWLLGTNWRLMVGLGAVPAMCQMLGLGILRAESPRWLVTAKGDLDQARKVLERVYGGKQEVVDRVLHGIKKEASRDGGKIGLRGRIRELTGEKGNRKALVVACLLQGAQQICGFNTFMYFSATIFAAIGFTSPTATALLIALTNFIFTIVAFTIIDKVGRRRILLLTVPVMTLGLALSAVAFGLLNIRFDSPPPPEASTSPNGTKSPALVLPPLILFVAAYALGLGNVPWQQPELFSSSVRALGAAFATSTNWAANTIVGATFLPLVEKIGAPFTFSGYAIICVLIWVGIWRFFPERMGRELETTVEVGDDT